MQLSDAPDKKPSRMLLQSFWAVSMNPTSSRTCASTGRDALNSCGGGVASLQRAVCHLPAAVLLAALLQSFVAAQKTTVECPSSNTVPPPPPTTTAHPRGRPRTAPWTRSTTSQTLRSTALASRRTSTRASRRRRRRRSTTWRRCGGRPTPTWPPK